MAPSPTIFRPRLGNIIAKKRATLGAAKSGRPWETVTLTTLYAHRHIFEEMFTEAHAVAAKSHEGKTRIYNSWGAAWQQFGHPRRKRPLESVVLDEGIFGPLHVLGFFAFMTKAEGGNWEVQHFSISCAILRVPYANDLQ